MSSIELFIWLFFSALTGIGAYTVTLFLLNIEGKEDE